jgi:hypothetical protein
MALQIRRGTEAQRGAMSTPLAQGELIYTTDQKDLWVGDGVTNGGTQVAPVKSVNGVTGTVALTTDQITQGSTNKYYSSTQAKIDVSSALIAGNATNTGITFSYNSGTISAVVTNVGGLVSVQSDANPSLGANLSLSGKNITGTGNININGSITGTSVVAPNATLGNISPTDSLSPLTLNLNTNAMNMYGITTAGTAQGPFIKSFISRGTLAAPTTVNSGDFLSGTLVQAHNGANYLTSAFYGMIQDSTISFDTSSTYVPSSFVVSLWRSASIPSGSQSLVFNSKGTLYAPVIQTGLYATGSYPASPAKGMIIFDSTLNHFYGYNGTAWVAFTGP